MAELVVRKEAISAKDGEPVVIPMAYTKARDVLDYIGETMEVERRLRPLYNFKAVG
jgi:hypothetical protein